MWLKKVEIKNFRSIENLALNFTKGINVIFGENGTGKTNIIKAILKILGPAYPGPNSFTKEDYFNQEEDRDITIHFTFDESGYETKLAWGQDSRGKLRLIRGQNDYVTSEERERFCPLHIPPSREIKDLPASSKWTPIGHVIFRLAKMIEADSAVLNKYNEKMKECVGVLESSAKFSQFKKLITEYSKQQIGTRGEEINIELGLLDPKNILKSLQIFESVNKNVFNICDGGHGIQSNVTMAALRAFSNISNNNLFVIADEPEAFLHPVAQKALSSTLTDIADKGTQIILTTHSPHFISPGNLSGIKKIQMDRNRTTKVKFFDVESLVSQRTIRTGTQNTVPGVHSRLSKAMTVPVREGLFARKVVLCEGETEALSLEIWAELMNLDFSAHGIAVVEAGGKFSMIELAEFYKSFNIHVYLIFDSDSSGKKEKSHKEHNRYLLNFAGLTEEDFPDTKVTETCAIFSPDLETVLRSNCNHYSKFESKVNGELGLSSSGQKGIRARYVSLEYKEKNYSPPQIIQELITAIFSPIDQKVSDKNEIHPGAIDDDCPF